MAGSFATEARFVVYSGPVDGPRIWVTVPAWAHRVTAPLIKRPRARPVPARHPRAQRGGRPAARQDRRAHRPAPPAVRLHHGRGAAAGSPGQGRRRHRRGLRALRTSVVTEDTEWSVRYVFTDPVSGDLWPRAADRLDHAYVLKVTRTHVTAELGTTGVPARVTALRMPVAGRPDQRGPAQAPPARSR